METGKLIIISLIITTIIFCIIQALRAFFNIRIMRQINIQDGDSESISIPIKRCPFCGKNVAEICSYEEDGETHYVMMCIEENHGCGCSTGPYSTIEEAVHAWNRRSYYEGDDFIDC